MRTRVPWFALAGLAAITATLPAHASPSLLTLHDFAPGAAGAQPIDPLVYGADGNIYGVTQYGGSAGNGANGFGTVYKMTQAGVVTTLHNFTGSAGGYNPWALTQGADGNLYGVTEAGGSGYYGTIFKLTTTGTFTILHNFTNGAADGRYPYSPPLLAAAGTLYGATENGGANNDGMIYKLTPGGTFSDLHDFAGTDGFAPRCTFVQTVDGTLYGATDTGTGSAARGSFFRIHTDGSNFSKHQFTGTNGYGPGGKLLLLSDGNFYGCTGEGGVNGHGTVFRVLLVGVFLVLFSFFVLVGVLFFFLLLL